MFYNSRTCWMRQWDCTHVNYTDIDKDTQFLVPEQQPVTCCTWTTTCIIVMGRSHWDRSDGVKIRNTLWLIAGGLRVNTVRIYARGTAAKLYYSISLFKSWNAYRMVETLRISTEETEICVYWYCDCKLRIWLWCLLNTGKYLLGSMFLGKLNWCNSYETQESSASCVDMTINNVKIISCWQTDFLLSLTVIWS